MPRGKLFAIIAIVSTLVLTAGIATAQGRHAASRVTHSASSGKAGVARTVHILKAVRSAPLRSDSSGSSGSTDTGFVEFYGTVESMPATGTVGDWVISGRTVHVTDTTFIESEEGTISVGSTVEVKGVAEADGSITASKIEMESESGDDESGSNSGSDDDSESDSGSMGHMDFSGSSESDD